MPATRPTPNELADALRAAAPALDRTGQRLAVRLYRALSHGLPVAPTDLAADVGVPGEQIEQLLDEWPGVYRDTTGNVSGFWGLALSGFPHQIDTGTATVRTWCALDPFLIAPLLDAAETRVRSTDPITGQPVTLTITHDRIQDLDPPTAVVSILAPQGPFDADIVHSFCHYVHFFASPESGHEWTSGRPGTFLFTVEETNEVALGSWPVLLRDALDARSLDRHGANRAGG